jgi:hypothetical protein
VKTRSAQTIEWKGKVFLEKRHAPARGMILEAFLQFVQLAPVTPEPQDSVAHRLKCPSMQWTAT